MSAAKKLSLSEDIEGPNGLFHIRYLNKRWEIHQKTIIHSDARGGSLGKLDRVATRHTRQQATDHARKLAGSFHPLPDRRAAIAHTRGLS
jgi:hypothetical protein